jgi:nucleoside-diphosphate-sugar epimerase
MRVLLLGGTGFIGGAVNRRLRATGHDTVTVGRTPAADLIIDATDVTALGGLLAATPYDVVVNLLGSGLGPGPGDAESMTAVNAALPPALLRLVSELDPAPHLIHAASSTERLPAHTEHESEYSRTKHAGTTALRYGTTLVDVPVTILAIHNTYGPGQPSQRFAAHLIAQLSRGRPVTLNFPHRVRDLVYLHDVAACIEHAIDILPSGPREVEIGTGMGISLLEAGRIVASVLGQSPDLVIGMADPPEDPNPVTVATAPGGTFGTCTTGFAAGIRQTIEEA